MKGEMLSKMLRLTTERFDGVYDQGGNPYILHCLKVMHYIRSDDEELQCIALGHDLIEDTNVTDSDLLIMGFTTRVTDGIIALSKIKGESSEAYLNRVKSNKDAVKVKLADLRHNSDIRRLKGIREKDIKRMIKYHEMYLELSAYLKTME